MNSSFYMTKCLLARVFNSTANKTIDKCFEIKRQIILYALIY